MWIRTIDLCIIRTTEGHPDPFSQAVERQVRTSLPIVLVVICQFSGRCAQALFFGRTGFSSPKVGRMPLSLNDPTLQSALKEAQTPRTVTVTADGQSHTFTTPFPSPQDWRDAWIYFLMIDRFNRSNGTPPVSLPSERLVIRKADRWRSIRSVESVDH